MKTMDVRFVSCEGDIRRMSVEVDDDATEGEVIEKAYDEDVGGEILKIIDVS